MSKISIGQAWSYAVSFFAGQGVNHAIVLIGVGIFAPMILQFGIGGGAAITDPMAFAGGGMAALGGMMILLSIIGYIIQTGSYFASWRIGLTNGGEPLGSALGFGIIAALPVLLLGIALGLALAAIAFLIFGSAMAPMLMGGSPEAAAGTGALLLLLIPVFLFVALWLAARFCCMGPIMADRRSYNVISALGESWRLTAASQWKIIGYFVLLFVAAIVIFMILAMIVGVSMFAGGGAPDGGALVAMIVGGLLLGIPMAYLQVGIPAGIYKALGGSSPSDIFA